MELSCSSMELESEFLHVCESVCEDSGIQPNTDTVTNETVASNSISCSYSPWAEADHVKGDSW